MVSKKRLSDLLRQEAQKLSDLPEGMKPPGDLGEGQTLESEGVPGASARIQELETIQQQLEQTVEELTTRLETAQHQENAIQQLEQTVEELNSRLQVAQHQENAIQQLEQTVEELTTRLETAQHQENALQQQIVDLTAELATQKTEILASTERQAEWEISQQRENWQTQIIELESQLTAKNAELSQLHQEKAREISTLQAQFQELQTTLNLFQQESQTQQLSLQQEINALQAELSQVEFTSQEILNRKIREIENLQMELAGTRQELQDMSVSGQEREQTLQLQINQLESELEKEESFSNKLLREKDEEILSLMEQLEETQGQLEVALTQAKRQETAFKEQIAELEARWHQHQSVIVHQVEQQQIQHVRTLTSELQRVTRIATELAGVNAQLQEQIKILKEEKHVLTTQGSRYLARFPRQTVQQIPSDFGTNVWLL